MFSNENENNYFQIIILSNIQNHIAMSDLTHQLLAKREQISFVGYVYNPCQSPKCTACIFHLLKKLLNALLVT